MPSPIGYFEVCTKQPETVRAFYRELFDWEITTLEEGYDGIATGGIPGGLAHVPDAPVAISIFVEVASIEETIGRATAAGGALIFPSMPLPNGRSIAMLADPTGVMIGVIEKA